MGLFKSSEMATRPRFVEFRSSKRFITFAVSFASATDIFMYGLIVPVTPTALRERVGIPPEKIQAWTSILLSLFSVSMLAFSPIVGYLTHQAGSRKGLYLFGLVALAAATALLCTGSSLGLWIAGRLLQGAAAAVVWVVGITIMADAVGRDGLGQAMGYMSMAASVGTLTGPLLGGVLYEKCGYYSVFVLAFVLIGVDILLRFMLIERKDAVQWLAPEMRPLVPAQDESDTTDESAEGFYGRMSFLVNSSRLMAALWGNFVIALFISSFDSVLPLFVEGIFQWKQSGQGLIFIPLIVAHVFDPVTGYIIDKYPRTSRYITAGAFFIMAPLFVLLQLVQNNSMHDKIVLCALLSGLGLCLSVTIPPIDVEVFSVVEEKEKQRPGAFGAGGATALAFGLTNMGFSAGMLVGPFFAGFIRQEAGWGTMSWALGSMAVVSGIPILLFMGGPSSSKPARSEDEGVTVSEP